MVNVAVDPEFSESGKVLPTMEKPVPVVEADEIVTADVPVDESVTVSVVEEPNATVPKLNEAALNVNLGLGVAVPVPLSETIDVALVAELLMIVNVPVTAPAV